MAGCSNTWHMVSTCKTISAMYLEAISARAGVGALVREEVKLRVITASEWLLTITLCWGERRGKDGH